MIRRNDPCHCGSGKKYKKCCGSKGSDLVDIIVNEELDRVLMGYFDNHLIDSDRGEMQKYMRTWVNRLTRSWDKEDIEEASSEFYLFIQNKEKWHTYLKKQLEVVKREGAIAVLKEWDEPFVLLAEITDIESGHIKVRELFGEKEYRVTRNEGMPTDVGTLLFGVVLRDSRKVSNGVAPVSSILFLAKWSKQTKKSLFELRKTAVDKTAEEFIHDHILDIYELLIKRSMASMNELVEEVLEPTQLSALKALEEVLLKLEQPSDRREIMHKLSVAYFLNENPDVPVIGDYLAAAVKCGIEIGAVQGIDLSQEQMIQQFGASEEGMQSYINQLSSLYEDMMDGGDAPLTEQQYDIGTDPKPGEKALWETSMTTGGVVQPERKPSFADGRAQLLAFDAYLAETEEERRKLAKNATALSAENSDVLLLKIEIEKDLEEVVKLYEKAIQNASRTFEVGEQPWQNIPNRPFMRAAFAYGVYLFGQGEYNEASSMFLDLLKMNPVDNQGARYEAVASLIHAERYEEAAQILVRYEKGSSQDATYLYLDWQLEHAGSAGESENAAEMLQLARAANSHVMHLMTFKVKPISYPRYESIEPGSEGEARYIWLLLSGGK
ncbi:tetratricopeptide repeat protein [Sporosarcina sp. G11-34]|uniref:tetratricopeptide repeat protein n=1 Tax=Sporosarcina sp. G11-34 TaxID=2849605 RepID=UPI0022A95B30|nr:SEC-C metal-binding domain-containing protein [Sporosarcina sp. G11-34]MCZ2257425.1 SEC-C domain-containing protein [Sporosarcina sp. G11-34]